MRNEKDSGVYERSWPMASLGHEENLISSNLTFFV